jgi:hypothetical protein
MAQQREFTIQLRFHSDDPEYFESIAHVCRKACRELKAMCVILAGPGVTPPNIILMSEDFVEGSEQLDYNLSEQEALQEQADRASTPITPEDKVL